MLTKDAPGIYSFEMFSPQFCSQLLEECEHYEKSGLPVTRPNSMNNYGMSLFFSFRFFWSSNRLCPHPLLAPLFPLFPLFLSSLSSLFPSLPSHPLSPSLSSHSLSSRSLSSSTGLVLNEIGFKQLMTSLMHTYIIPLASLLFPQYGGDTQDSHHSFIVRYKGEKNVFFYWQSLCHVTVLPFIPSPFFTLPPRPSNIPCCIIPIFFFF